MPKGRKSTKGVPELHDELKTRVNLTLTPTAIQGLDSLASELELSRSELVEQIGRGTIRLEKKRIIDSMNSLVRDFLEKATQRFSETNISISSINIVLYRERDKLPNAPGSYIVSDWLAEYQGSGFSLKKIFSNEHHSSLLELNFPGNLDESCFILWLVCQDYKAIYHSMQQLRTVFVALRNELWLDQLAHNLFQPNLPSESHEEEQIPVMIKLPGFGESHNFKA